MGSRLDLVYVIVCPVLPQSHHLEILHFPFYPSQKYYLHPNQKTPVQIADIIPMLCLMISSFLLR